MRVAIIGGGAMGTLFAAKLAPHTQVWMISSHLDTVEELQQDGARVVVDGKEISAPVKATLEPEDAYPSDLALIWVKAYETERAAKIASQVLDKSGVALTLQNGLGNAEILAHALGSNRVLQGVTYLGASWLGPGKVRQAGEGMTYLVAKPSRGEAIEEIVDLFQNSGLKAEMRDDGESLLWGKLIVNAAINPLTAILRVPNGGLLSSEWAQGLLRAVVTEGEKVARAANIRLPYENAVEYVEGVCQQTASNYSSMLQDVLRKRPTEIEAINGALVREGEKLGLETLLHRTLRDLVHGIETSYGQEARWR